MMFGNSEGRNRSSFELLEAGANNVMIETLQFQLDGLFSQSSSTTTRRRCIWKIISIVQSQIGFFSFRGNGLTRDLIMIVRLLKTEKDYSIRSGLLALTLTLCCHEKSVCSFAEPPPLDILETIFNEAIGITSVSAKLAEIDDPSKVVANTDQKEKKIEDEANKSVFHRKRIFKNPRISTVLTSSKSSDQGSAVVVTEGIMNSTITDSPDLNLRKLFPAIFLILSGVYSNSSSSNCRTHEISALAIKNSVDIVEDEMRISDSALVALLIVNRYITAAVLRCYPLPNPLPNSNSNSNSNHNPLPYPDPNSNSSSSSSSNSNSNYT